MDDSGQEIELYIYDLTQGLSSMMSGMLLGRHIEGVWHTAIVAFGREYFFGSGGIQSCTPGGTVLREPLKKELLGFTFIPYQIFKDYLRGLAETNYRGTTYNLLQHNCNNFSEELAQFLCGKGIPSYILDLPSEILSTPLGQSLAPLFDSVGNGLSQVNGYSLESNIQPREVSPGFQELISEVEKSREVSASLEKKRKDLQEKIAKKEQRKLEKKKRKQQKLLSIMSEVEIEEMNGAIVSEPIPSELLPSERAFEDEARERHEEEERKRARDPPVVFTDIDPKLELDALVKLVDGVISKDEEVALEEMHQYLLEGEGSWALGDGFLIFVGRILRDPSISTETRVHLLRALANAALKDDIILLLHQDRRDHVLMNYAQDIDKHAPEEQQALALFMCNLFENTSSSEWLLYISEWNYNNSPTSNIRAATKLTVHCLLATCPTLQDLGTALIHNLACKEVKTVVFDDVAIELTMAILQYFNSKPNEEYLFRTMKALARFVTVSADIPQLVQMIGPDPKTFKGASGRVDELIDQIAKKLR